MFNNSQQDSLHISFYLAHMSTTGQHEVANDLNIKGKWCASMGMHVHVHTYRSTIILYMYEHKSIIISHTEEFGLHNYYFMALKVNTV